MNAHTASEFFKNRYLPKQDVNRMSNQVPEVVKSLLEKPLSYFTEIKNAVVAPGESPTTRIAFILDSSGSMALGKNETITGFNAQLQAVREGARTVAGTTHMTYVEFSDNVRIHYSATPVVEAQELNSRTYQPNGGTALYDAIGATLATLLALPDGQNSDCATLVQVFTDGEENTSKVYNASIICQLIERLEATGRWTFALIGPKRGVTAMADSLAINKSNVAGFDPSSVASRADVMTQVARASSAYMCARSSGSLAANSLYPAQPGDECPPNKI